MKIEFLSFSPIFIISVAKTYNKTVRANHIVEFIRQAGFSTYIKGGGMYLVFPDYDYDNDKKQDTNSVLK